MLKIPKSTIDRHIQRLGFVKKLDTWIPHELKEIHSTKRINACNLHFKHNEFDPFFKRIITGHEKWIFHNNVAQKRSWSKRYELLQTTSKAGMHPKKLFCLFGGIGKVWCFLSCFQVTNRSIWVTTVVS